MIKLEIGKKYKATNPDITYVEPIKIDFTGLYALCAVHYIPSAEIDGSVREDIWYYVDDGTPLNVTRFSCIIVGELTSSVQQLPRGGSDQVLVPGDVNTGPVWMSRADVDAHHATIVAKCKEMYSEYLQDKKVQCECGAYKIRHAMHSNWCPMYSTGGIK